MLNRMIQFVFKYIYKVQISLKRIIFAYKQ